MPGMKLNAVVLTFVERLVAIGINDNTHPLGWNRKDGSWTAGSVGVYVGKGGEQGGGGVIDVAMASQQTERDCEGLFPERLLAWADGDVARGGADRTTEEVVEANDGGVVDGDGFDARGIIDAHFDGCGYGR